MMANNEQFQSGDAAVPRWKRTLDKTLIMLALPVILPVGGAVALLVYCVSRGPIFFRQERVGHLGKRFQIVKFRTMHTNADTSVHEKHTTHFMRSDARMLKMDARDSRIIPLGRWIRAAGLDELPQLLNVWHGDMSITGPRPCLVCEYEKYQNWQQERFNALPGLTGLWQVSGKNNTTFHEMIQLDIEYSRNKSATFDLEIMARTLPALVTQVVEMRRSRKQLAVSVFKAVPQVQAV